MFSVAPTLGKSKRDVGAVQPVGEGLDVAVAELERRAHRLEAGDVHVDRAGAEVVAAGQRQRTCPQRPSSGPSTLIDARMRSTSSYGATGVSSPVLVRSADASGAG